MRFAAAGTFKRLARLQLGSKLRGQHHQLRGEEENNEVGSKLTGDELDSDGGELSWRRRLGFTRLQGTVGARKRADRCGGIGASCTHGLGWLDEGLLGDKQRCGRMAWASVPCPRQCAVGMNRGRGIVALGRAGGLGGP